MLEKNSITTREIYLFRHGHSKANSARNKKVPFPKFFIFLRKYFSVSTTFKLIQFVNRLKTGSYLSLQADSEIPLESLGHEQAELTGKVLAQRKILPDLILCSDFLRTRQTANGILKVIQSETSLDITHRLLFSKLIVERDGGDEYGYPLSYYPVLFPETNTIYRTTNKLDFRPPGGESIRDVRQKRIPELLEILKQLRFKTLFIVGHGITNSTIVCLLTGEDIETVQIGSPNLGVYRFISNEQSGNWVLDPDFVNAQTIDPSIPFTQ